MKPILLALLLLIPISSAGQDKSKMPSPKRITPEQIKDILDFESDDEKIEEQIRKRLRKLDPRKDEAEGRILIAVALKSLAKNSLGTWKV